MPARRIIRGLLIAGALVASCAQADQTNRFAFRTLPRTQFHFEGELGRRIDANVQNWITRAPAANPGLLAMFSQRDRQPAPNLVPWAGEFVGKYLISAIQARRMSLSAARDSTVPEVVRGLIASQADDGYLGPFPKAERLRGNWDLWGHYHCMLALLMWHEATGDTNALRACRRAADLVCATFLGTDLRVYDAGSHEMNMAIIHSLGWLYRVTGEARYLAMMREIEKDWERAGDYLRAGLAGKEFFATPRPRWESLHDLQGLLEFYEITGDTRYRQAFEHHWRSIARWDRRNTGGFSSGEQATGNPYASTPIETCCTVAWMALTLDMLRLTGDSRAADELELATFNAAAGAQHPSGSWWTYNTPMDGVREASAHSIVFQARAGTPELNCCSVNGPRSLGMLSEWAVMGIPGGLVVNHYGPFRWHGETPDGTNLRITCDSQYPAEGTVRLRVAPAKPVAFKLLLRVPGWSVSTRARLNDEPLPGVQAGSYLVLDRTWTGESRVNIDFDLSLRYVTGAREATGKVSVYRGPLLLAYDQRLTEFDEHALPPLDLAQLGKARVAAMPHTAPDSSPGYAPLAAVLQPWLVVEMAPVNGRTLLLCDFASAGASGTRYRSWLAATNCPPPPAVARLPADGADIPHGKALFRWTGPRQPGTHITDYELRVTEAQTGKLVFARPHITENRCLVENIEQYTAPGHWHEWQVISRNAHGQTTSGWPQARFRLNPSAAPLPDSAFATTLPRPDGLLVAAALRGSAQPQLGSLVSNLAVKPATGPDGRTGGALEFNGETARVLFALEEFPEEDYSMAVWVRITRMPVRRLGQVFSAWCTGMDDPLRVCIEGGRLFARIEAGQGYSTPGVPVATNEWIHVAAVKAGTALILYCNGEERGRATVPQYMQSGARDVALGGNPHYTGNEFLAAQMADFRFYERALDPQTVKALANPGSLSSDVP